MLAALLQPLDAAPVPIDNVNVTWSALAPVLCLIAGGLLMLAADAVSRRKALPGAYAASTVLIAVASIGTAIPLWLRV